MSPIFLIQASLGRQENIVISTDRKVQDVLYFSATLGVLDCTIEQDHHRQSKRIL